MKRNRQQAAKASRKASLLTPTYDPRFDNTLPTAPTKPASGPLKAQTPNQERYIKAIKNAQLTFGLGPAGTGKTYIAGALAAQALLDGDVEKIIITRPAVEAGESLGFLPGELEEKYAPYIAAFRQVLVERLGQGRVDYMLKRGTIEAQPLAYMRGLTFKNAFVIMDEAQNATPVQMKLFLTRIGEGGRIIVNGDLEQQDIGGKSGLEDAVSRLSFIPSVQVVRFTMNDIVRSDLCGEIVRAYAQ